MSSVFKIFSPEDCDFYYDGDLLGRIIANSDKSFRFEVEKKGTYRLLFINCTYKSELRRTLTIGPDEEQIVDLDFSEVNAEADRKRRLEEEKRKSEEEAERRRIAEEKRRMEEAERQHRLEVEKRKAEEEAERRRIIEEKQKAEEAERQRRIEVQRLKHEEEIRVERKRRTLGLTFQEGLAPFEVNGKWAFIDESGREITAFKYDKINDFVEGFAKVHISGKWGFIDKSGREITPIKYDDVENFKDEFAKVKIANKWGVVNRTGKEVASCLYDLVCGFRDNKFLVIERGDYKTILKTAKGFTTAHDRYDVYPDGIAIGHNYKNHKKSLIDIHGGNFTSCIYDQVSISATVAIVEKDGKYGILDKSCQEVISCVYDCIIDRKRENGLLDAKKGSKWGLINKTGSVIVSFLYDKEIGSFMNGLARVKKGEKEGLIDIKGKEVYPCIYSYAIWKHQENRWVLM